MIHKENTSSNETLSNTSAIIMESKQSEEEHWPRKFTFVDVPINFTSKEIQCVDLISEVQINDRADIR